VTAFVVKISDVAPDGHSALIVDGSLNGTRRQSLASPEPMNPGTIYQLNIPMAPTGWVVNAGHRLRVAVSSSDFPNLWPTPEKAHVKIYRGGDYASRVVLPLVPASSLGAPTFLPPPKLVSIVSGKGEPPRQELIHDQISGVTTVSNRTGGTATLEDGGTLYRGSRFRCWVSSRDPAASGISGIHEFVLRRWGEVIEIVSESAIQASATEFDITTTLTVKKNGEMFHQSRRVDKERRRLL
jgi:hypothetical protein